MRIDREPNEIDGVRRWELRTHFDARGEFTELFRQSWGSDCQPVQWNLVRSRPGVLRGVHVHRRHSDYLLLAGGRMLLGLCDLRPESPTYRVAQLLDIGDDPLAAVEIPPGVAHGFYLPTASLHVYAVSHYWDPADELGCRWNDPELGIPWPELRPRLSERDQALPSLAALEAELRGEHDSIPLQEAA